MTIPELRDLIALTLDRNTSTLRAEALEADESVVCIETDGGELYFLTVQEA